MANFRVSTEGWGKRKAAEQEVEQEMEEPRGAYVSGVDATLGISSATSLGQRRFSEGFRPKKMCRYASTGACQRGLACSFAHSAAELHPSVTGNSVEPEEQWKEQLISSQRASEEVADVQVSSVLGPREFDPNYGKPTQLCHFWLAHPTLCTKGDECTFAHGLVETGREGQELRACASSILAVVAAEKSQAASPPPANSTTMAKGCAATKGVQATAKGVIVGKNNGQPGTGVAALMDTSTMAAMDPTMMAMAMCNGGYWGSGMGYSAGWAGGYDDGNWESASTGNAGSSGMSRFEGSGFTPTKICEQWFIDPTMCQKGDACTFAHGVFELNPKCIPNCGVSRFHHTGFQPKKMCQHFVQGKCTKGLWCTFAHQEDELAKS
eukprot:TRINITY_DN63964_c0_g1_i1.p1 TRINITY_DN63964_c0_g1~~TRINITY_DN63964_c0_g1_i1.p1  ORF type:complete len:415 (+),score=45.83 TRINITY_DN63964_c0_g1_i1:106-1245(+)